MQLSSELIYLHLQKQFSFTMTGELSHHLLFERPVFWLPGTPSKDYCIYLCGAENISGFPQSFPNSLLLVTGIPKIPPVCQAAFCFSEEISLPEIYNSLHELYTLYETWDIRLYELLYQNCSLHTLLDCCENIFQNPILVHNREFEFIAYSSLIDKNPNLSFLVEQERSQEAYCDFRLIQAFQQTFLETEPQFFPDTITGIKSLYINLFNHGEFIGRIVIPEVMRPLRKSDIPLLRHLSQTIQIAITSQPADLQTDKFYTLSHLIGQILNGKLNEDSYIKKAMKTFHWQNDHAYFCSVFNMDPWDIQNNTSKIIRNRFEMLVPDSCTVEFNHKIVMFVNLTLNGRTQPEVIHLYAELARDNFLKIGCSKVYTGFHFSFQLLYLQAEIALKFGSRYMPDLWIHHFNQIADKYLLEKLISDMPAEMVCAPEIVEMHYYDIEHHTEYLFTLKIYLDNNMQPVSTARELFIHRTTLAYRLEKIQELFHISIDNAHNRLFFRLSIQLLETTLLNGAEN